MISLDARYVTNSLQIVSAILISIKVFNVQTGVKKLTNSQIMRVL